MEDTREMTLEQYEKYWYQKSAELFGERFAKKMQAEKRNHYIIMKQLWIEKGFTKYREYADWEKDHIEERNKFFEEKGEKYGKRD